MGLFEFGKPKWRHKDPAVRLKSINSIDPQEIEILTTLGREDQDREVRRAAINRLTDLAALDQLENDAYPEDLPVIITQKENLLYDHIVHSRESEDWLDELGQVTSVELLAQLAVKGGHPALRLAAVARIEDQHLLAAIIRQNCGKKPAVAALEKIMDESLLADLVKSAAGKTVRRLAAEKIAEMERLRNQSSDKEITARKLDDLVAEVTQLSTGGDIDVAALRLIGIRQEWQELDPTGIHPAHGAFSQACNDFEAEYEAEIQERRTKARKRAARREQLLGRLEEICGIIERLSCVTAADAEAAKGQAVTDWEALAEDLDVKTVVSETMAKRFATACRAFDANRIVIRHERRFVQGIEEQCDKARAMIAARKLKKAEACRAEALKSLAPLKFKFFNKTVLEKLIRETSLEIECADKDMRDQNLSRRREICETLENLTDCVKHGRIEQQLQAQKQAWQQLVKVDDVHGKEFEQRYREIIAELTDKLQMLQREQDWQLWANLRLKEELSERVVSLENEEDLETVVKVIKEAQSEWKKIGHIPYKKSQQLWDTFHNACNRNFERAKSYLEELTIRRSEAMDRRREICALTAELSLSDDWQKTTRAIKKLQEEWKILLHGSRREEQKLYQQFRKACDRFFERRKEFYQSKDEERRQHLSDKEKLCEEAEQLAAEPQTDYSRRFQHLQAEWKKIGPVPRVREKAIWKRFRAACDTYYSWIDAGLQDNLKRKKDLCEAAEKLLAGSTSEGNHIEITAQLAELQQQWKAIGPVPRDQSEAIRQRFQEPCDRFFTARQQQFEKEEEQQRINQSQKEELLGSAEEMAVQGNDKETAAQLKELQRQWFEIEPAPRRADKELNDCFKTLCDAFFEDRRQFFIDLQARQLTNQKKKESLCLRLENILGLSYKSESGGGDKVLSLAEELKLAMEDNFMLAGRRNEKKGLNDEVKRIKQDWEKIGPVPYRQAKPLTERYKKAMDSFGRSRRS